MQVICLKPIQVNYLFNQPQGFKLGLNLSFFGPIQLCFWHGMVQVRMVGWMHQNSQEQEEQKGE